MPNTGKPSRDCHLCRQRRVKCDLARPACQRCIKYGVECPGYRNEQDVVFRNTSASSLRGKKAAGKGQAKTQPRSRDGLASSGRSSVSAPTSLTTASPAGSTPDTPSDTQTLTPFTTTASASAIDSASSASASPPPRALREMWTLHSVPLLIKCYASTGFLSKLFTAGMDDDDPLLSATHLWARAYLTNKFKAPEDPRETFRCLSRALQSVATAVRDRGRSRADNTMMAVWMLGIYEVQIGALPDRFSSAGAWNVHSIGLLGILRARGMSQLCTETGRDLFWAVFTNVQLNSIIMSAEFPPEVDDWLDYIEETLIPGEILLLSVARYLQGACRLISQMEKMTVRGLFQQASDQWLELMRDVDAVERAMGEFISSAPIEIDLHGEIQRYFWNKWRSARLKMHNLVFLVSNMLRFGPVPSPVDEATLTSRQEAALAVLVSTAESIMDSIPVSLGGKSREFVRDPHGAWFEGLQLVFPLTMVFVLRNLPRETRLRAKCALFIIGEERGILQAFKSRSSGDVHVPEARVGILRDDAVEGPVSGTHSREVTPMVLAGPSLTME